LELKRLACYFCAGKLRRAASPSTSRGFRSCWGADNDSAPEAGKVASYPMFDRTHPGFVDFIRESNRIEGILRDSDGG
jgi:hypothetical protein